MSDKYKSICLGDIETEEEIKEKIELLSPYITSDGAILEAKIYKAIVYTNIVDREGERASDEFLSVLVDKIIGVPVIKNHDILDVDGIVGRVIKSELIEEDGTKKVKVLLYVVDWQAKDKIDSGLYDGVSLRFDCDKTKDNILINLRDVYELSFVCVPAVPGATITKTFKGGIEDMNELETMKAEKEQLVKGLETANAKIKSLETELEKKEEESFNADKSTYILEEAEKSVDEMEPNTEDVKEAMIGEFNDAEAKGDLVIEHLPEDESGEGVVKFASGRSARVKGLETTKERIKTKYTKLGLLGKKEDTTESITKSIKPNNEVGFSTEYNNVLKSKSAFTGSSVTIK